MEMQARQLELKIMELLNELAADQKVQTEKVISLESSLARLESSIYGFSDREGLITRNARIEQRLNLIWTLLVGATSIVSAIAIGKFLPV